MPGEDSGTPIADGAEGLRELRDQEIPQAVDSLFNLLRRDTQEVHHLVEQARHHLPAELSAQLDEQVRAVDGIGAKLHHDLAAALSPSIDELSVLRRDADHDGASTTSERVCLPEATKASPERDRQPERDVIYVSSRDPGHADVLRSPPPDHVIVVDEVYVYTTDATGRVERAQATFILSPPARRKPYQQRTLPGKEPEDDAGHLFAASLGGIGDHLNLAPMTRKLNRSDFASVENEWRDAVKANKSVDVTIDLR